MKNIFSNYFQSPSLSGYESITMIIRTYANKKNQKISSDEFKKIFFILKKAKEALLPGYMPDRFFSYEMIDVIEGMISSLELDNGSHFREVKHD